MSHSFTRSFLITAAISGLVACGGGGDGGMTEPAAPSADASAAMTGSEGGGNGGANGGAGGGASGNGGGEGGGSFNIVFGADAQCGVDFISPQFPNPEESDDQRQLEIYTPCGPQGGDFFITNDGVINNVSMECDAVVRARYQEQFPVVNTDCD